ncbi:MAG: SMP-30/gluconolactonase/LRE family protein [Deltaproteobacteria bacterium]|nr:SMP-30/gluconolactonase/LRE family protein [Deltaproteobacteria bacterium]
MKHRAFLYSAFLVFLLSSFLLVSTAEASGVRIFKSQGGAEFLAGELEGVRLDALGRLLLAQRMDRLAELDEPFLLTAAAHPDGWLLGTGNDGRVLHLDSKGNVEVVFDAPEPEVFALWSDPDGSIFAGTSPNGKIYRITAGGSGEPFFDPQETYIWDIRRASNGDLLVATGTRGKLFTVDDKGEGRVLFDSHDVHLRTLLPLDQGGVLVGTAGEGLVLHISPDGKARTVFDAVQPEIVALTAGADGALYAAAVASEASLVDLSKSPSSTPSAAPKTDGEVSVEVTTDKAADPSTIGSRPASFSGSRSEILSLSLDGSVDSLWSFQDETVYSLLWAQGRLWAATGQEGKLYSYRDVGMVLEKESVERQLVRLLPSENGLAFGTTNGAAFYRAASGSEEKGSYISRVLDAGQPARFGSFRWEGKVPPGGSLSFAFRSGLSATPDATWAPWSAEQKGEEIPLSSIPIGRYVQWRALLIPGKGESPRLDGTQLSYLQRNLKPKIQDLVVLQPGQILVPSNFNPGLQAFEPAHPTRDGIFTTLDMDGSRSESRLKPLWKLGYRSLRWQGQDPNQDPLIYHLEFRPAGEDEAADDQPGESGDWLSMAEDLEGTSYSFDATVLPDGLYRFRLSASDRKGNRSEEALIGRRVTQPVTIDHSAPVVESLRRKDDRLEVKVRDAWNPLREAVYSVNAGEWQPAPVADGMLDGEVETLVVEVPSDIRLLLLRLTDAAQNVVTIDLMRGTS